MTKPKISTLTADGELFENSFSDSEPRGIIVFLPRFASFLSDDAPPAQRLIGTCEVNGKFSRLAVNPLTGRSVHPMLAVEMSGVKLITLLD